MSQHEAQQTKFVIEKGLYTCGCGYCDSYVQPSNRSWTHAKTYIIVTQDISSIKSFMKRVSWDEWYQNVVVVREGALYHAHLFLSSDDAYQYLNHVWAWQLHMTSHT